MRFCWWNTLLVCTLIATALLSGCAAGAEVGGPASSRRSANELVQGATALGSSRNAPPTAGTGADDEPHGRRSELSAALAAARSFYGSYVAFLYGRLSAGQIRSAGEALRRQLAAGRAWLTPAERASRPRVTHLTVATAGPPVSATATATLTIDPWDAERLTVTLEPRPRGWIVVAIGG